MIDSEFSWRVRVAWAIYYPERPDFVSNESRFATWVMIFLESGRFQFVSDGCHGEAGPGDLVIIEPNARFTRRSLTPIAYHSLTWEFVNDAGDTLPDCWRPGLWPLHNDDRALPVQANLRALAGRLDGYALKRIGHSLEGLLLMAWETRTEAALVADPTMNEAARLLRAQAGTELSMRSISTAVDLKPVQFTRRFKAAFGVNPVEYLTAQRLKIAQRLLVTTDLNLDEIAHRCGWSSGYYLSHVFSLHRGMAPGQFRKLHRG